MSTSSLPLLALHGWRTNGKILTTQTAALRYHCGINIIAPNAPFAAQGPPDPGISMVYPNHDYYQWWIRRDDLNQADPPYEGVEESLNYLVDIIKNQGPFKGIIGFSQGTAMVTLLMSRLQYLSENNLISKSLIPKFTILICGIPPPLPLHLESSNWPIHSLGLTSTSDEWRSSFLPYDNSNPLNNPLINYRNKVEVTKDTKLTQILNYNNNSDALLNLINNSTSETNDKISMSTSSENLSILNELINQLNKSNNEGEDQQKKITYLKNINPLSSITSTSFNEDNILSKYNRIPHTKLKTKSLHLYGSKDFLLLRSFFLATLYDKELMNEYIFNEGHHIPSIRTNLYPEIKKFIDEIEQ